MNWRETDSYGSTFREQMFISMEKPAGYQAKPQRKVGEMNMERRVRHFYRWWWNVREDARETFDIVVEYFERKFGRPR